MKTLIYRLLGRERRRFARFVSREMTPVFIGRGVPPRARLNDISIGGVSLDYTAGAEGIKKIFALDIEAEDGFHLGKVLLEKLSDREIRSSDDGYERRLRGRFLNLSQAKANKLQRFLEVYREKLKN